jgi:PAS domain S-box-containing protein
MRFTIYALPILIGALLMLGLALYTWQRRRERPEAAVLTVLLLAVAGWSLAYGLEIMAGAPSKWFWETWSVIFGAWIGPAWILMALRYTGQERWLGRRNVALLSVPATLTTVLALTNPWHLLVWTDIQVRQGPFLATVPVYGPWFWVHIVLTYTYITVGVAIFFVHILRQPQVYRRQAGLIITATVLPIVGNVLYLLKLIPIPGLDPGPFFFAISALLIFLAIFRYRFLDLVPVAQRTVLESMQDGVIVLNDEGLIVDLNPAARRMMHLSADGGIGQPATTALPVLRLENLRGPAPTHAEVSLEDPDRRWVEVSMTPLLSAGGVLYGQLVVLRDITVQVELAHMKDEFVSTVTHELRTPLTSVLGFTRLIQRQFERNIRPYLASADEKPRQAMQRVEENLGIIISEGERLTRLINDVLDLAKMEAGRVEWHMGPLSLPELIARCADSIRGMAAERGLEVDEEISAGLPFVQGDSDRLAQVLTNLLSNAVKFTERGRIAVRAWLVPPGADVAPRGARQPAVETGLPSERPWVAISVEDTGVGISAAYLGKIFTRFQQVQSASRSQSPGTGLGLTICREIIEHHGGHIWAESEADVGSRFVFTLPVPATSPGEPT